MRVITVTWMANSQSEDVPSPGTRCITQVVKPAKFALTSLPHQLHRWYYLACRTPSTKICRNPHAELMYADMTSSTGVRTLKYLLTTQGPRTWRFPKDLPSQGCSAPSSATTRMSTRGQPRPAFSCSATFCSPVKWHVDACGCHASII